MESKIIYLLWHDYPMVKCEKGLLSYFHVAPPLYLFGDTSHISASFPFPLSPRYTWYTPLLGIRTPLFLHSNEALCLQLLDKDWWGQSRFKYKLLMFCFCISCKRFVCVFQGHLKILKSKEKMMPTARQVCRDLGLSTRGVTPLWLILNVWSGGWGNQYYT